MRGDGGVGARRVRGLVSFARNIGRPAGLDLGVRLADCRDE